MIRHTRLVTLVLAAALLSQAGHAGAADYADLHAYMVRKLGDSCVVGRERLARFEHRMIVVHAVVDQTSLPSGWARAKVLRPVLGGLRAGAVLPMAQPPLGVRLVKGKEYLISMFRYGGILVVDRALECSGA